MPLNFSVLTSLVPDIVTKRFTLNPDQSLGKTVHAHVIRAHVAPVVVHDLASFGAFLYKLKPNQALLYGVPNDWRASNIVVQSMLDSLPANTAIARTNRHFRYPAAPGILMLDYDPPKDADGIGREDLVARLRRAVPELAEVPMLWLPSASSHICVVGGADLTGLRGQRLYIAVADATDIPRLGALIALRLWAAGEGRFEISCSGALLERTLVDTSVWQPSRLDFAAGAAVGPGLEQRRRLPFLLPGMKTEIGELVPLDSREVLPDASPDVRRLAEEAKRRAREERQAEARRRRRDYIDERRGELLRATASERPETEQEAILMQAIEDGVLGPDFVLHLDTPGAENRLERVTVADMLAAPERFNGRVCCDPLEPEYNGWSRTAKLYLTGDRKSLCSLAHGGRTFRLIGNAATTAIRAGGMAQAVRETLALMRQSGSFLNLGDALVTVNGTRPSLLNEHALAYRLDHVTRFVKQRHVRGEEVRDDCDPPEKLCRQILHIGGAERDLPTLKGIAKGPFIRLDGTIRTTPGFDPATGCYGHFEEDQFAPVPERPTREECTAAHEILWRPFRDLRLDSSASRTALLCALLTAPIRPALDKAPMFASIAPDHGSGKSLVTEAIGALAIGSRPAMMSPLDGNADEMRKRLTACLLPPAEPVLVFDNATGHQESEDLANFLTASSRTDRILGQSRMETDLPNRALVLMSGKGLSFSEELARRTLSWTIDPSPTGPYDRGYAFCPVEMVLEHRPHLVIAALTLMRAAHVAGRRSDRQVPSYAHWDALVRQTVLWIAQDVIPGAYEDPLDMIRVATDTSTDRFETYDLLAVLYDRYGDKHFRSVEVATAIMTGDLELKAQLDGLTRRRGEALSARSIGRHLRTLRNRRFNDLTLRAHSRNNMCEWQIERGNDSQTRKADPG
jgi:hypothetical protein